MQTRPSGTCYKWARALGVDRTSVHRWVKADKIKYGRHFVNGRVFIKGIELIRIMNS